MPADQRIHELDAARALAIVLVIAAHGLLPFFRTDVGWAVHEPSRWLIVDGVGWVVRAFVMPLFFLLSGFWACASVRKGGLGLLIRQRAVRIGAPLAVVLVPMSLAMSAMWDRGKSLDAARVTVTGAVPELRASEHVVTMSHLWFLYYLLVITGLAVAVVVVARLVGPIMTRARGRLRPEPDRRPALTGGRLSLVMSLLASLPLWWAGKLQLDVPLGFAVDAPIALFHGVFFLWGWLLHGRERGSGHRPGPRGALAAHGRRVWLHLVLAALGFAGLLPVLLDTAISGGEPPPWAFWLSAWFTCAMIAAALGLCARFLARPRPAIRLVSAASYWSYVVHLPALVLAQVLLHQTAVPSTVKYLLAVTAVMAFCLLSYRQVVRPTWLSRFLG